MQNTQTASLDSCKCPCIYLFDCCFIQQFLFTTPLAKLTRNPELSPLLIIVTSWGLGESTFGYNSVRLTVSEVYKSFWDCPGVVSTTCCHCDINWCILDVILCDSLFELSVCDSSFESSVLHPFMFVTSSSVTHSSNCLTIITSCSKCHCCVTDSFGTSVPHLFPLRKFPVSCFSCFHEFPIYRIPVNSQESLIVA